MTSAIVVSNFDVFADDVGLKDATGRADQADWDLARREPRSLAGRDLDEMPRDTAAINAGPPAELLDRHPTVVLALLAEVVHELRIKSERRICVSGRPLLSIG